jgi:hypothetical protein
MPPPENQCPACQKKENNNRRMALALKLCGQLQETNHLHECWEHMAEAHGHNKLSAAVYRRRQAATKHSINQLEALSQFLTEESRDLQAELTAVAQGASK